MLNVHSVNATLWKLVQEHIDNNYNPNAEIEEDCIDWFGARKDAHEALQGQFSSEDIDHAIDLYMS